MNVWLHGLNDMPWAKAIFEEYRAMKKGKQVLDTRMYNTFIDACVTLASCRETVHHKNWV